MSNTVEQVEVFLDLYIRPGPCNPICNIVQSKEVSYGFVASNGSGNTASVAVCRPELREGREVGSSWVNVELTIEI